MTPIDAVQETSPRVTRGRTRKDPNAPWPEFLGVVACIQYIRSIRGEGVSYRKLMDLVASRKLPHYSDGLSNNRKGEPVIKFKREDVREFVERSLRRVEPTPLGVRR